MADDGLVAALARAQANFPSVPKSRTAKVKMKSGGEYSYTYADLADVLSAVRPVLAAEGIALVQSTDIVDGGVVLVTRLLWGDESIEGRYPLHIGGQSPQEVGSLLTYFRRYTATSILGISAQDDDDGQQAQQSHRAPERQRTYTGSDIGGRTVPLPDAGPVDSNVLAAAHPPDKPIAAMTVRELIDYAREIGVPVSGSKSDMVRTLEPYVLAASGEEPWPVEGEGGAASGLAPMAATDAGLVTPANPSRPEPRVQTIDIGVPDEQPPFNPVVAARAHLTGSERKQRDAAAADIREGR